MAKHIGIVLRFCSSAAFLIKKKKNAPDQRGSDFRVLSDFGTLKIVDLGIRNAYPILKL